MSVLVKQPLSMRSLGFLTMAYMHDFEGNEWVLWLGSPKQDLPWEEALSQAGATIDPLQQGPVASAGLWQTASSLPCLLSLHPQLAQVLFRVRLHSPRAAGGQEPGAVKHFRFTDHLR